MEESVPRDFVVRSGSADPPGWEKAGGSVRWIALSWSGLRDEQPPHNNTSALFLKLQSSSRVSWRVTSCMVCSNKAR